MAAPLKVVILGGGTSGWMCAAALIHALGTKLSTVSLVESAEIGTVGVGEATLPQIKEFNDYLGINEVDFMRETQATFKLGIEFRDWGQIGNSYIHPFGTFGLPMGGVEFQNYWTRAQGLGDTSSIEDYSYAIVAARQLKFDFPDADKKSIKSTYSYAYHFDAGLYATFLRKFAEAKGLKRFEGKVASVDLTPETGDIRSLTLDSGETFEADLFVDCSGFRGLLIEGALKAGWEDWSQWLPCDRAYAVPCERAGDFTPYTCSTALTAGWQWRIPLQHRTGNGYVYASNFITDEAASDTLLQNLDGKALADPRPLRFQAGRRKSSWYKNCVTIGLSSGFLEPLESTSIYLVQVAVMSLIRLLPSKNVDQRLRSEFNRLIDIEYERVRDFLILHYHANMRDDSALWDYTRHMSVPDSLTNKIEQFTRRGYIPKYQDGLFSPPSWLAVFMGQGVSPQGYDRVADNMSDDQVLQKLSELKMRIASNVSAMPTHADFIRDYCDFAPPKIAMTQGASL